MRLAVGSDEAQRWNDSNILCLSLRLISPVIAQESLDAWFDICPEESERPISR